MNGDTIKRLEEMAKTGDCFAVTREWQQVIQEIGNTNGEIEVVASVMLAQERVLERAEKLEKAND